MSFVEPELKKTPTRMETTTNISNHLVKNSPSRSKEDRAAAGDHNIDHQLQKVEESTLKEINNDDDKVVETDEATQTAKSSTSEEGALMQHVKTTPSGDDESGRERLKRHRMEMAGRVWIPDTWGQEDLLKDWIDCSVFDASLVKNSILSARATLMQQTTTHAAASNASLRRRIENRC